MDRTGILDAAREGIAQMIPRTVELIRTVPDVTAPLPNSAWSVQEGAVHLTVVIRIFAEVASGAPAPVYYPDGYNEAMAARHADIPETDPVKLAALVEEAAELYLDVTAGRSGDQAVDRFGTPGDLAGSASSALGEYVLHGYDIAVSSGRPWPIDPGHAGLILVSYLPFFPILVDPVTTAGLTAAVAVELRGGGGVIFRFVDGQFSIEPAESGPVDCSISADPVAFLMVGVNRMSRWQAAALGLISATGERPEFAWQFNDWFVFS